MYRPTFVTVILLLTFTQHVIALNILAIVSLPLKSHYMAFQTLFRELANRGHSVTVLNNFPDENPVPNLNFVNLDQYRMFAGYMSPLSYYETVRSSYIQWHNLYMHLVLSPSSSRGDCDNFFTNENVKAHFAEGKKYDVIFVEQFMGDCPLAYAASVYDAPIIGITSHVMLPWSYSKLGIPFDFSSDRYYFSKAGANPSLFRKVESFLMDIILTFEKWYIHGIMKDVFKQHLPGISLDVEKAAAEKMKMLFVYQHFSWTGARLLSPQVLEIGGIHIGQPKPVPEAIERFLSKAKDGAIYVSFGSNLKSHTMSQYKLEQFLNAFKQIPQKVLWTYENASFSADHENIYFSNWFPQLDILCHPKVLAFVMQGGMLSISEAVHCGKPVLIVPFFGDQLTNAAVAEDAGLGRTLYFDLLNADNLAKEIKEMTSQKMQENAKKISSQWHDRPLPVMDSAVYWTEYVARHKISPPSLPSQRASWFESLLLDVAAVIIVMLIVLFAVFYLFIKLLKLLCMKLLVKLFYKQKSKTE